MFVFGCAGSLFAARRLSLVGVVEATLAAVQGLLIAAASLV